MADDTVTGLLQIAPPRLNPKSQSLFLKGVVQSDLGNNGNARKLWLEALKADVRCFDAFNVLVQKGSLTVEEEMKLWLELPFIEHCVEPSDSQLVSLLYSIQLKLYGRIDTVSESIEKLEKSYGLAENLTVMESRAGLHAIRSQHALALEITTNPALAVSWYAVGAYYLLVEKTVEARQAFGKACKINPTFGEAWVAHGHALSLDGGFEQAAHAYGVAGKCFEGVHHPSLFIGMQYVQFGQNALGEEYLKIAASICATDSIIENERGVVAYHRKEYKSAIKHFVAAVKYAGREASRRAPFDFIWCNLGNAYRNVGLYTKAKICFKNSLSISPTSATCLTSLGIVEDALEEYDNAILHFHEALSIAPEDALIADFLNTTLSKNLNAGLLKSATIQQDATTLFDEITNLPSWMKKFEEATTGSQNSNNGFGIHSGHSFEIDGMQLLDGYVRESSSHESTKIISMPPSTMLSSKMHMQMTSRLSFGGSDSDSGTPMPPLKTGLLFGVQRRAGDSLDSFDDMSAVAITQREGEASSSSSSSSSSNLFGFGLVGGRVEKLKADDAESGRVRHTRRSTFLSFGSSPVEIAIPAAAAAAAAAGGIVSGGGTVQNSNGVELIQNALGPTASFVPPLPLPSRRITPARGVTRRNGVIGRDSGRSTRFAATDSSSDGDVDMEIDD
ncbi:anaphase promoting complex subunit cdc16 [Physocladia obscura]|uniref:Anaphase promoting complex subunit cdc16 n=1 Tax=Physocladia obscura TaxID=109957 RepID=A0AAD5SN32_9FUNG|nr:anaphase promoting complex subunit cdc16 [Physocladia obscura]